MKKLLLTLFAVLFVVLASAQDPSKKTVIVDYFGKSANVNSQHRDMARASVLSALTNSARVKVVDAQNEQALALSQEAASADVMPTLDNIREGDMKKTGANLLLSGMVTNTSAERRTYDDGTVYYAGFVNLTLDIKDLATGQSVAAKDLSYGGLTGKTGKTKDEAIAATLNYIALSMTAFINDHFKIHAQIVQIEEVKKDKARMVYINVGSNMGIKKEQLFSVKQLKMIGGSETYVEIGKLTVENVSGEGLTLCNVRGGGEIILEASKNPQDVVLIVESGNMSAGSNLMKGLGGFFK